MKIALLICAVLGVIALLGVAGILLHIAELLERPTGIMPKAVSDDDVVANTIALHMRMQRGMLAKTDEAMSVHRDASRRSLGEDS